MSRMADTLSIEVALTGPHCVVGELVMEVYGWRYVVGKYGGREGKGEEGREP